MSRTSDTRQRTRETAADLVAQGHRPHEITVDLIYAAIRQGSRTTINDELKLWKDEKTQADALGADLPPVVADRMRSLWVIAVEHGERVFEQRRGELEAQLATAREQLATVESARDQLQEAHELLSRQITALGQQLTEVGQQLSAEAAGKNEAVSHAHALQQELTAVRLESARQLESVRLEQEKQADAFQQAIMARDAMFRAELDRATERLESAQAHMLQQIDDARQGQRRAETQAGKIQQQRDKLQDDMNELRMQLSLQSQQLKDRNSELEAVTREATRKAAERQALETELAVERDRLQGVQNTVRSLEARAVSAEARLAELALQRDSKRPPRTGRAQQG
jgi:chromosome segregation ATPase